MNIDVGWPMMLGSAFALSFGLSATVAFVVRPVAIRLGWVDRPGGRRIHTTATPNVGGVAVAVGTLVPLVALLLYTAPGTLARTEIAALILGGLAVLVLGMIDDQIGLRPWTKFAAEWCIGSILFWAGVRILGSSVGPAALSSFPLWASYGLTVFWLVGATNAFNLLDGSDGIAGGAAAFASGTLALVFTLNGEPVGALVATLLLGACLGFLVFNFPPASIFLGDGGSLFLGFTLAGLGVITTTTASTMLALAIPVIAFAVPLLDTSIAIVRRFLRREAIFSPDRGHIHHRLRDLGHSPRGVALLIYVVCAVFAALSLLLAASDQPSVLPVFLVAGLVLLLLVQRLRIPELMQLSSIIGRGFQQRLVISHNLRVINVADQVAQVTNIDELRAALARLLENSEFTRLILRVPSVEGASRIVGEAGLRIDSAAHDDATVTVATVPEFEVRLRVPFQAENFAELSLFRSTVGERLYTDLRLVADPLVPQVGVALRRLLYAATQQDQQEAMKSTA